MKGRMMRRKGIKRRIKEKYRTINGSFGNNYSKFDVGTLKTRGQSEGIKSSIEENSENLKGTWVFIHKNEIGKNMKGVDTNFF